MAADRGIEILANVLCLLNLESISLREQQVNGNENYCRKKGGCVSCFSDRASVNP